MKINYDELDELFESMAKQVKVSKPTEPVGSLTDNRRKVKPNRDGSYKRMMNLNTWRQNEAMRQYFGTGVVVWVP